MSNYNNKRLLRATAESIAEVLGDTRPQIWDGDDWGITVGSERKVGWTSLESAALERAGVDVELDSFGRIQRPKLGGLRVPLKGYFPSGSYEDIANYLLSLYGMIVGHDGWHRDYLAVEGALRLSGYDIGDHSMDISDSCVKRVGIEASSALGKTRDDVLPGARENPTWEESALFWRRLAGLIKRNDIPQSTKSIEGTHRVDAIPSSIFIAENPGVQALPLTSKPFPRRFPYTSGNDIVNASAAVAHVKELAELLGFTIRSASGRVTDDLYFRSMALEGNRTKYWAMCVPLMELEDLALKYIGAQREYVRVIKDIEGRRVTIVGEEPESDSLDAYANYFLFLLESVKAVRQGLDLAYESHDPLESQYVTMENPGVIPTLPQGWRWKAPSASVVAAMQDLVTGSWQKQVVSGLLSMQGMKSPSSWHGYKYSPSYMRSWNTVIGFLQRNGYIVARELGPRGGVSSAVYYLLNPGAPDLRLASITNAISSGSSLSVSISDAEIKKYWDKIIIFLESTEQASLRSQNTLAPSIVVKMLTMAESGAVSKDKQQRLIMSNAARDLTVWVSIKDSDELLFDRTVIFFAPTKRTHVGVGRANLSLLASVHHTSDAIIGRVVVTSTCDEAQEWVEYGLFGCYSTSFPQIHGQNDIETYEKVMTAIVNRFVPATLGHTALASLLLVKVGKASKMRRQADDFKGADAFPRRGMLEYLRKHGAQPKDPVFLSTVTLNNDVVDFLMEAFDRDARALLAELSLYRDGQDVDFARTILGSRAVVVPELYDTFVAENPPKSSKK